MTVAVPLQDPLQCDRCSTAATAKAAGWEILKSLTVDRVPAQ
jgi:hypothetical protein